MQTIMTSQQQCKSKNKREVFTFPALLICAGLALAGLRPPPVWALDYSTEKVDLRFDTTLSYGGAFRVEDRDKNLIGVANGGWANSINSDNGNLNYDPGDLVSLNVRAVHEVEAAYKNFGFFGRFYYFYDLAVREIDTERTPLTKDAKKEAGGKIELLDAYIVYDFNLFDRPISIRAGNQLLSWGESTFIQNGVNIINPVDVSQLRVAGAELREALLPVPMVSLNAEISDNLSVEGFYQLMWQEVKLDPEGTFFSTSDLTGPGARRVFLKFGRSPSNPFSPGPSDYPLTPTGAAAMAPFGGFVPRDVDVEADDMGQGGVALRYFASELNDTEFGLYYIHYHSRKPVISGHTSTIMSLLTFASANSDVGSNSRYFLEYPEDIDVMGLSFNTDIPAIGLAIQGECSYRWDQPLQVDDVELLYTALSPYDPFVIASLGLPFPKLFGYSQLGAAGFDEDIQGYRRKDVVQGQVTLTKIFGPMLGMDQLVVLGEIGATYIRDMEEKDELRYEGYGTFTSANSFFTLLNIQPATQEMHGFADEFSMGYRLAMRADFNNAIGAINMQPAVAFYHDVSGNTPLPIANFVEDRMTVTVSLTFTYLNKIRYKMAYTNYFGAGEYNLSNDRDFASVAASYSF